MTEPTTQTADEIAADAARDAELHSTPATEAIERIKEIPDVDLLRGIAEREARNPKVQGGRKTVLAAIDAQITALVEAAAAAAGDGAGADGGDPPSGPTDGEGPADGAAATSTTQTADEIAAGLVRCRVKADAGDFHLPINGRHVATPAGTELTVSADQFERMANHLERID